MYYKNLASFEKTFYGVTFKPGEIKEVPGFINDKQLIVVPEGSAKKQTEAVAEPVKTASAEPTPKKEQKKSEGAKKPEDTESQN